MRKKKWLIEILTAIVVVSGMAFIARTVRTIEVSSQMRQTEIEMAAAQTETEAETETSAVQSRMQTETGAKSEMETVQTETSETEEADQMESLEALLTEMIGGEDGTWSIYVKNLDTDVSIVINDEPVYAASLIKLFVMEKTFRDMDMLIDNDAAYTGSEEESRQKIMTTLENMIEISDNESYNELVRIESSSRSFSEGCTIINNYLQDSIYSETRIYHTLSPSNTEEERISSNRNHTSAVDCGMLLEAIYDGTCVSEDASSQMLDLLLAQQSRGKIPAGVPEDIEVANKTGETDETQHDAAIVYGEDTDYILCVLSDEVPDSNAAASLIREISSEVYVYLNPGTAD
ncbi:MAG TPA: serine hydrolase [Candidatus Scybalocola faecipullorum]|nr:serine hydrolase [Candidatus Scybalocola faecipullorum]